MEWDHHTQEEVDRGSDGEEESFLHQSNRKKLQSGAIDTKKSMDNVW